MSEQRYSSKNTPKSTFDVYLSEGDAYFRRRRFVSAIKAYSLALRLRPNCVSCLIKRSKCFMLIARPREGMEDIKAALALDPRSYKAMLQMAEVLYQSTAFESALLYFYRGQKVRPTANDFILGVTKSKSAIINAIGEPRKVKFALSDEAKDGIRNPSEVPLNELPNELLNLTHESKLSDKHFQQLKRLMGKSYDAVQHFQQLSNSEERRLKRLQNGHQFGDRRPNKRYEMYLKNSKEISQLAAEAYRYLGVRSEFWRQQEPMYNRIRKCRKKTSRNVSSRDDMNALQRLVHMLQDISDVQRAGDHVKALQLCAALREDMKVFNPDFAALTEVMADLHAFEAVSNFHLQNYKEARDGFLAQLETCRNGDLQHHIPRCLENLGRAYAKLENYQAAKEVWTERLQYETTGSEKSWLHFELGLCNMELGEYEEAVMNGLVCKKGSERAFDMDWELRACVLIAQAHLALNNLNEAQTYFQNAQYAAYTLNNQKLEELLVVALEKVEAAIEENERKAVEEEYESFANAYYPPNQARRPMLFAIGAQNRGISDEGSEEKSSRHSTVENSPSFSRTHEIGDEDGIDAEEEDWEDLPDYLQSSESTLPRQNRSGQESNL